MNPLDTTGALAAEVQRDRLELGRQSRLATIARCCHPSTWSRATRRLLDRVRTRSRRRAPQAVACCT